MFTSHLFPVKPEKRYQNKFLFFKKRESDHPTLTYFSKRYAKLHNLHHYIPHVLTVCTAASEISDLVHANSSIQTRVWVTFVNVALALCSSVPYQVKNKKRQTIICRILNRNYMVINILLWQFVWMSFARKYNSWPNQQKWDQ